MTFTLSMAAVLGAVVLLCAFLQISRRRIMALLTLSRISALALGAASLCRGLALHEVPLFGVVLLILVAQLFVLPRLIRRLMRDFNTEPDVKQTVQPTGAMMIGVLPVGLAVAAMAPMAHTPLSPEAGVMAIALAVLLLGLWLMIIQSQFPAQIIGLITLENGLVLGLINIKGLAWAADIAVITLLGLVACLVFIGRWRHYAPSRTRADGVES